VALGGRRVKEDPVAEDQLIETLRAVLAPFPEEQREEMLSWAAKEMKTAPVVTILASKSGATWKIGEAPPSNDRLIVFAILLVDGDDHEPFFCIYSVGQVDGGGMLYFKELVFDPRYAYGPLSPEALYTDFEGFFAGEFPTPTNGVIRGKPESAEA
jgi:hypothetical protein